MRVKGRKLGVSQQHEKISEEREQKYKLESVNKATPGVQSLAGEELRVRYLLFDYLPVLIHAQSASLRLHVVRLE